VLFATGIVIVGLIGIASILPVAIRNSTQSNTSAEGLSLGLAWADSFLVRGLHQPTAHSNQGQFTWVWRSEEGGTGWRAFNNRVSPPVGNLLGQRDHSTPWRYVSVCIDPNLNATNLTVLPYRSAVFPYFSDALPSNPSGPHPRMLRIGMANNVSGLSPVSEQIISNLFSSNDELVGDNYLDPNSTDPNLTGPDRDALPARRLFLSPTNVPLRSLTNGQYKWMATISRLEPSLDEVRTAAKATETASNGSTHGLVSILVLHRHDHFPTLNPDIPSPNGERLVRVRPLSGDFVGGAGGRVLLEGGVETSSQLAVGDWIMLGRYYLEERWSATPRRYTFFRWYRVIGLSSEPLLAADLSWSREVVLEGPDFGFATTRVQEDPGSPGKAMFQVFRDAYPNPNPDLYPTYGTLLGGVVTVVERQVKLQ
jgi:hypothetical protein